MFTNIGILTKFGGNNEAVMQTISYIISVTVINCNIKLVAQAIPKVTVWLRDKQSGQLTYISH